MGHTWVPTGAQRKGQKASDDLSDLIMDLLTAFARLAAYRTGHDPDAVRCLAYLFDEENPHLRRLGAFTGERAFDDRANRIPCSRNIAQGGEEEWYIISRAFSGKEYVCDDVDWGRAERFGYRSAGSIWGSLSGVAACPMRPRGSDEEPIGVVCVDSAKTVEEARWAGNQSLQSTLESLAGILYLMVAKSDYLKRRKRRGF